MSRLAVPTCECTAFEIEFHQYSEISQYAKIHLTKSEVARFCYLPRHGLSWPTENPSTNVA